VHIEKDKETEARIHLPVSGAKRRIRKVSHDSPAFLSGEGKVNLWPDSSDTLSSGKEG
jgi:hypothetical protein